MTMADEPESLTLVLLREIRAEQSAMREDFATVRTDVAGLKSAVEAVHAEQHALASLIGKVVDAVQEVAEQQRNHGARLNTIDGRLAIIEKRTGLVGA